MKGRNFGRIAMTGLGLVLLSSPAFAQQEGGGLNLIDMFESMGPIAIAVACRAVSRRRSGAHAAILELEVLRGAEVIDKRREPPEMIDGEREQFG